MTTRAHETSPRSARVPVHYRATVIASDGHESEVVVTDISAKGFRIDFREELFAGERVQLDVGKQGSFDAEIKWVRGSEAGGVFV